MFKQQDKKDKEGNEHDNDLKSRNDEYEHPLESEGYQDLGVLNQMSLFDKLD